MRSIISHAAHTQTSASSAVRIIRWILSNERCRRRRRRGRGGGGGRTRLSIRTVPCSTGPHLSDGASHFFLHFGQNLSDPDRVEEEALIHGHLTVSHIIISSGAESEQNQNQNQNSGPRAVSHCPWTDDMFVSQQLHPPRPLPHYPPAVPPVNIFSLLVFKPSKVSDLTRLH